MASTEAYDEVYGDGEKPRSLLIPVKNSDQAVEVFADEIPEDVNDIIDILRAEVAPLDVWLQFAVRLQSHAYAYVITHIDLAAPLTHVCAIAWIASRLVRL